MFWFRILALAAVVVSGSAHAKMFRNAYVSFELPPNWNCKLEGSEWVCENDFAQKTKEAIILLTAKEVGGGDTMAAYLAHLQQPRAIQGKGGAMVKSQVMSVKERMITNHMWIDALHLGSEIGPYFTRYLGTIKERIAVLVTFSAHKEHYTKYSGDFIKAIETLKVVATKDTVPGMARGGGPAGSTPDVGQPGNILPAGDGVGLPNENLPGKPKGGATNLIAIAVICLAIGIYLFLRNRKGKKSKSKSPSRSKKK